MMSLPDRKFLESIDQSVSLIIWVSKDDLSFETKGFKECDYLCDGLISEYIKVQANQKVEQNVFHTNLFGKKFFISFQKNSKSTLSYLDDVIALISNENFNDTRKTIILIQDEASNTLNAELTKRYPVLNFSDYIF